MEGRWETLRPGARAAVRVCMGVRSTDRVVVITDESTRAIGEALAEEANAVAEAVHVCMLERYQARPITALPQRMREDLAGWRPTVTFYAASARPGEVGFRLALRRHLLYELRVRHGHMPGITPRLMREGMAADYQMVARVTQRVWARVREARRIRVTSPAGTDLVVELDPARRWIPCTGLYHEQGQWGNLPEGEVFTAPRTAQGVIAAQVLGDYFSERYGVLASPVTLQVEHGQVVEITCAEPDLAAELFGYLRSAENGTRVGEFAIGTNIALSELTGNLLQDEKMPGAHIAFGNPYPEETGADWTSEVHVDVIPIRCTIEVDGEVIMREGRFASRYLEPE